MSACMKAGCPAAASHSIKIIVPDETDAEKVSVEAAYPHLLLCHHHAETADAAALIEAGGEELAAHFTRFAKAGTTPDAGAAYVEPMRMFTGEHEKLHLAVGPRKPN